MGSQNTFLEDLQLAQDTGVWEWQTWKMSIHLHKQICFNSKFYPEARKLRQNENCDKTANYANNTFFGITTLLPRWYLEVNPF